MAPERHVMKHLIAAALTIAVWLQPVSGKTEPTNPLVGTWTLLAADVIKPDGTQTRDYGNAPKGLLMIDADGHYTVQIYDSARPKFASGQKDKGTPAEYQAAIIGNSVHFGTLSVDTTTQTITLNIQQSTYPNQEGTTQKRIYEFKGDVLSYRVPPRPDGSVPVSVWRRLR